MLEETFIDKKEQIQTFLNDIEKQYQIIIILAIESGSRAWGFPSKDSDYDIRLIYHHPKNWYISAFNKRNVIENIFDGDLDAAGWDITKCMQLLYKGNAPFYEWLHSPIVYRKNEDKLDLLKSLAQKAFNPKVNFYHYISLAKKKLLDETTRTSQKSFLYAFRALLCAKWIADTASIPPVEFVLLTERYISDIHLKEKISELLVDKLTLSESDKRPLNDDLWDYANTLFLEISNTQLSSSKLKKADVYDETLLKIVNFS